jgi:PAS domain S-box-containing protein
VGPHYECEPDGVPLYENQAALDYYGITLEEWLTTDKNMRVHPQDAERALKELPSKFRNGFPFEAEVQLKRRDGQYRWFHFRLNPMWDEQGRIKRWHAAGTDIEDRKVAEQRLRDENVALREEIDRSSMFEEIAGSCESMRQVLKQVAKVAPSDATVLILGETGTGKELIARALHRRSNRAAKAFVRVNCAAIPQSLIAPCSDARGGSNPLTAGHFSSMKSAISRWRRRSRSCACYRSASLSEWEAISRFL